MRIVTDKFEYMFDCNCHTSIAYSNLDISRGPRAIKCPNCGMAHKIDGSHQTYMLEKVSVYFGGKRLPAPS